MLAVESLSDSLFAPQLLQQWLDGAGLELPPVNAVRFMRAPCMLVTASGTTCLGVSILVRVTGARRPRFERAADRSDRAWRASVQFCIVFAC